MQILWEKMYELIKRYYQHYGNSDVPQKFKTINGVDYDETGFNLGLWVSTQRQAYKSGRLSTERETLLREIKMNFGKKRLSWEEMYELAKNYYDYYGNLEVPSNFKTMNGVNDDENGISLGTWVIKQRQNYKDGKLSTEKKELLEKLAMRFEKKNLTWEEIYSLVEVYYHHYGNLQVPSKFKTINGIDYDELGFRLDLWLITQRQNYKNNRLTPKQVELLKKIDMRFEKKNLTWEEIYELAKNYYDYYDDLEVQTDFKTINGVDYDEDGYGLGLWIYHQRQNYKKDILSEEKIQLLGQIGMRFENRKKPLSWEKMYELAKKYYQYHGNLEIKQKFKTTNGIDPDENGINLGIWIMYQRKSYKIGRLSTERIELLNKIGMIFDNKKMIWEQMYDLAKNYYNFYKDLEVPQIFKTINGVDYDETGFNLGFWVINQRQNYKNNRLTPKQVELLRKIEIRFNNIKLTWRQIYELAEKYFDFHGNLEVPGNFKTINGVDYDENGISLGSWVTKQRQNYKDGKLSTEKKELLEKLDIRIEKKDLTWEEMYELAKAYYHHYGNLEVPLKFKTINGIDHNESGICLGSWLEKQKKAYKKDELSKEKIKLLKEIGMVFANKRLTWEEMYELAQKYYKYYGNLNISSKFKTINGIDYDENGVCLRNWISNQKNNYKKGTLSEEQVFLLEMIGIIFNIKTNKMSNMALCEEYGLDYNNNKFLLENISYKELNAKINYLLQRGLRVMCNNKPHEIFFMSDINMQIIYEISKEELLTQYYTEKDKVLIKK